jgi:hypothetical protein
MFVTFKNAIKYGALAAAVSIQQLALAAPIDVTANVTEVTDAKVPMALLGGAVLGVVITLAVWKWLRRAV